MCKTSKGKIKTTFIRRTTIGNGKCHMLLQPDFSRGQRVKVRLVSVCLQQRSASRFRDMKQPVTFWKALRPHCVISGPDPHAVLDKLPTLFQNQKKQTEGNTNQVLKGKFNLKMRIPSLGVFGPNSSRNYLRGTGEFLGN